MKYITAGAEHRNIIKGLFDPPGKEIVFTIQAIGFAGVHLKNLFSSPVIFQ